MDVSHTSSWPVQVAARQRRLRVINIAVGLLLGVEGALMLALSNTLTLPITASYLTNDPVAVRGPTMPERRVPRRCTRAAGQRERGRPHHIADRRTRRLEQMGSRS